jgi:predicted DNA-binding transcriptional regulator YafY
VLRSERLVKLLELLSTNVAVQASVLTRECGTSERTLRRDLDALTTAGFAVYFDHGYRLTAPALLPAITLTVDEALALRLVAQKTGRPATSRVARALATASQKLQQVLAARSPDAPAQRQMTLALPVRDPRAETVIAALSAAIAAQQTVRVTYAPALRRRPGPNRVDPYKLLPAPEGWELLAYCHDRRRILRIPVAHLREAAATRKRFRPLSARLLERHMHHGPPAPSELVRIRLACRPPLAQSLRKQPPVGALMWEDGPEGSVIFTLVAVRADDLLPWLLACSDSLEVLEPPGLRAEIRRIAQAVAARHLLGATPASEGNRPGPRDG